MNRYLGHISILRNAEGDQEIEQTATEHCRQTATYAMYCLENIGLGRAAYLAGMLHDCGKFTESYQNYLRRAVHGEVVRKGSVNHTFAGVRYLLKKFHSGTNTTADVACELLAYAVGAHHGLFDLGNGTAESGFSHRLTAQVEEEEAIRVFFNQCAKAEEIKRLFQESTEELEEFFSKTVRLSKNCPEHMSFYLGLLERLLLSALIEGDRRDTAEFMAQQVQQRVHENRKKSFQEALFYLEKKLKELSRETPIGQARGDISNICRKTAEERGGLYVLNVPTGAGKTLASLRYALAHSVAHQKQRIFFVMPLLSIIDQNSEVIRECVGESSLVVEHHSNVVREKEIKGELSLQELLTENWSGPITITTLVQFLETLFSGRTGSIRRFHSLCNSVIVIDEVQTVPTNMLTLFNLAINFLVELCDATVVLCSTTQPPLEAADHPLFCIPKPIVPYDERLWQTFSRTRILDGGTMTLRELPGFILQQLVGVSSVLVICNKKRTAAKLFDLIEEQQYAKCYHLSASMCMAHRRKTIEEMGAVLKNLKEKIVCISTQVMESGVDLSFGCVIRLTAGMDSIVQAAGRCNRNGELQKEALVYIVRCIDEQLGRLTEIQQAQNATEELLAEYRLRPERFLNNLSSDEAISYYYHRLYQGLPVCHQDFCVSDPNHSIFNWLSQNNYLRTEDSNRYFMQQAFATAGKKFQVFKTDTVDVLVPYGEGAEIIAELRIEKSTQDIRYLMKLIKRVKPYTISLFSYQKEVLEKKGALYTVAGGLFSILQPAFYNRKIGLTMEETT